MNYSAAIFLINPAVRAVYGIYEAWPDKTKPMPTKSLFKTLDQSLKVDDLVLVPSGTRHDVTVMKLVEVDVEVDPETGVDIRWVIGPVDLTSYQSVVAQEERAIRLMKEAEKTHQREELRKKMFAHVDQEKLSSLQIATATDVDDSKLIDAAPEKPSAR